MSLAHQNSKGQYPFFVVGGDFFTRSLEEAHTITTRK
jgi:hypothetical protein